MINLKELELMQAAYLSGRCADCGLTNWNSYYEAAALDDAGNMYQVIWAIRPEYEPEFQEEASACDWDNPIKITKL